ncbi:unnamed protein product [Onchocerca ochengi]|uniref:Sortilin_C domain-containing protein n=1 Tax=Onchocerca ochengi TaxID=42157 RepID=A0A182EV31_ONCOC|nr:unnamed protein product [Onchocerca ochengi]
MGLENQNHGDFDGFSDITLINWKELECADDSIAVLCDQRPIELYDYYEFPRCIELGLDFKAIICNSAYEYPANFNCDFYDKFFCQRSKRYIYSCICANNYRNA